ncbi:right-handed parallel beta-helix repeat-containing protein [Methanobrevibacter sp. 87.7]|uniref:right-handed parallel beta-helix repeat-containing protein n=1 Tax=Methanobrevibacter sp. 87.7 TaxID=387957 RepID=UPI001303DFBF|nr:right-handed parallel beta-helix repeat-containing protein [Methanobrevibacter sp. 87.7]
MLLVIILSFCLITSVSAASNNSTSLELNNTHHTHIVTSNMTNDEIQSVIDNASSGDIVEFNSKKYNNVSLVIDKKLNIISTVKSVLESSHIVTDRAKSLSVKNSFGFYFTSNSSGSILKGFTLTGNPDYQIMINGANNLNIENNTIISGKNGIYINNTKNSKIISNKISKVQDNGMIIYNTHSTTIKNNNASYNGENGVYFFNIKDSYIGYNDFSNNGLNGIELGGSTSNNTIIHNYLRNNINNIFINSTSYKDKVTQNTIIGARMDPNAKFDYDMTGMGVLFGDSYKSSTKDTGIYIGYNTMGFNAQFDAKNHMKLPIFKLGDNYYVTNDGRLATAHLCPFLLGGELGWENTGYLRLGFTQKGNQLIGKLYDKAGNVVEAGDFDIDQVSVDGNNVGAASYRNGQVVINAGKDGANVKIISNGRTIFEGIVKALDSSQSGQDNSKNAQGSGNSKADNDNLVNGGGSLNNTDNNLIAAIANRNSGRGSGLGSLFGSGNSNIKVNGSGIASGAYSGTSNNGLGTAGENGQGGSTVSQGSASSSKAYEIAAKKAASKLSSDNTRNLAVLAIFAIMILFVIGYKRRNKDDDDNDDY